MSLTLDIFKAIDSVRSNNLNVFNQRCLLPGFKDQGIRKFDFVAKSKLFFDAVNDSYNFYSLTLFPYTVRKMFGVLENLDVAVDL